MQIIEDKALLFHVKQSRAITDVIKNSKLIEAQSDGAMVAVKWGLNEAKALARLGFQNVPSPILRDYVWSGHLKPFKHQMVTSSFLTLHDHALCLSEAGTGKTASVIWATDYLMKIGEVRRALIVCPLSIMKAAWQADLFKFAMHRSVAICHGSPKARLAAINSGAEFVIINPDGLKSMKAELIAAGFDLVVADEATFAKRATTQRWKALNAVAQKAKRLWLLTGTPAAQAPTDAFGLAKLVNPDCPKYYNEFRDSVMFKVTQFKWMPRPGATQVVHKVLQPAIRFERDQCLDLPPVLYSDRFAPLTKMQSDYYNTLLATMRFEAAGETVSTVNAAANMTRLLQISGGTVRTDMGNVLEFDVKNRIDVILEAIEEASHKVLIFVPYTATINMLSDELTKAGVTNEVINGPVPLGKRSQIIADFQRKKFPQVLILQPEAAAHGLTLTEANTVIWYSPITKVETYLQGNARVNRPGQSNNMNVIHIWGSPIERKLYGMLRSNLANHEKLIELYREALDEAA
jgi:SNF2 family DNA or RNA helicase